MTKLFYTIDIQQMLKKKKRTLTSIVILWKDIYFQASCKESVSCLLNCGSQNEFIVKSRKKFYVVLW